VHRLALAIVAMTAAALPARATIGIRAGLEVPVVTHVSGSGTSGSSSYNFSDSLQPALNVLISAYPFSIIGFDAEIREGFAATGGLKRTGTKIGPGVTINPPLLPIYVRASLPIHLEPDDMNLGLRLAGGLSFNLVLLSLYLEGAVDLHIAGKQSGLSVDPFSSQQVSLGAGAWFKF